MIDDDGTILETGELKDHDPATLERYDGLLCPGFINAHCHLELSYMKGKIPERKGLVQFIIDLIDCRNGFLIAGNENAAIEEIQTAIRNATEEMKINGIVGIGDISNDDYTFHYKTGSPFHFHTFVEAFGLMPGRTEQYLQQAIATFRKARALHLSASITPHAPYSVSPELFGRIFAFDENDPAIFSYHSQECNAENTLFKNGHGEFMQLFQHFNLPPFSCVPTGKNSLQSVIGYFPTDNKTLFVHNTVADAEDLALIKTLLPKSAFCICPNANLFIEGKLPELSLFEKYTGHICIGTDSYASNHQLSVLEELKTVHRHFPRISTEELITWATLNGAAFFGWEEKLGSLKPGKRPGLNLISSGTGHELSDDSTVQKLA